jgi:hypothetical protein
MGEITMVDPSSNEGLSNSIDDLIEVGVGVQTQLRRRTWWFIATIAVVVVFGLIGMFNQANQTARLHKLIDQDCGVFAELGTIPLPPSPNPNLERIVETNRRAYDNRCVEVNGPLAPVPTAPQPTGG